MRPAIEDCTFKILPLDKGETVICSTLHGTLWMVQKRSIAALSAMRILVCSEKKKKKKERPFISSQMLVFNRTQLRACWWFDTYYIHILSLSQCKSPFPFDRDHLQSFKIRSFRNCPGITITTISTLTYDCPIYIKHLYTVLSNTPHPIWNDSASCTSCFHMQTGKQIVTEVIYIYKT